MDFGGNLSTGLWGTSGAAAPAHGDRPEGGSDSATTRPPDRDRADRPPSVRRTERGGQRDRTEGDRHVDRADAPRVPETGSRRRPEDIGETWPDLPEWATPEALDADARNDLRGLNKENAAWVAAHLVAAGTLADDDPEVAWRHARAARARGGRIAVVRETVGLVAYRAAEWAEAIGELRAARRMGGGPGHLAVLADCERALGHPEKAIELARSAQAADLDEDGTIELATVVAGARADLGQIDAALAHLEQFGTARIARHARLAYSYADLLVQADREPEALTWFIRAANTDADEETDALDRVEDLAASIGARGAAAQDTPPVTAAESMTEPTRGSSEDSPAETPPDTPPAETAPAETAPAETAPATPQAETLPDTLPAETSQAETSPAHARSTDAPSAEAALGAAVEDAEDARPPDQPAGRADAGPTVENDVTTVLFSDGADDARAGDR